MPTSTNSKLAPPGAGLPKVELGVSRLVFAWLQRTGTRHSFADHLRIVNGEIVRVIGALTKGQLPAGQASPAAVKPSPEVAAAVDTAAEESCAALLAVVATAAAWHALAAMHLGLHRVQIERIRAGLPSCAI